LFVPFVGNLHRSLLILAILKWPDIFPRRSKTLRMRHINMLFAGIVGTLSIFAVSCKKSADVSNTPFTAPPPNVSIISGNTVSTAAESSSKSAFNNGPHGICSDDEDNIYFSTDGNTILKLNALGLISTLAGNSTPGCEDGSGDGAFFTRPVDLCSDDNNNIYVADMDCQGLREVSSSGSATHFYTPDGNLNPALSAPISIAIDSKGNVYSADELGSVGLTMINPQGKAIHFAGDGVTGFKNGPAASAEFLSISSICIDDNNDIFIADNYSIREISGGQVTTIAGNGKAGYADGTGAAAQFAGAMGICIDNGGNIYVADPYNYAVRKVTSGGQVTTIAGTGVQGHKDGDGNVAQFNEPVHVCVDMFGNIYVTDLGKTGDEFGDGYIRKIVLKQ
jgi:hypothetical protein